MPCFQLFKPERDREREIGYFSVRREKGFSFGLCLRKSVMGESNERVYNVIKDSAEEVNDGLLTLQTSAEVVTHNMIRLLEVTSPHGICQVDH